MKTPPHHEHRYSAYLIGFISVVFCTEAVVSAPVRADDANQAYAVLRPENGYWSVGDPRWFVSSKSDIGAIYVKPYVSAGYGLPHWIWAGVDVNAIVTPEMFQSYAGVRAASPILDLAFGARDTWSFDKPFLTPASHFTEKSVLEAPGSKARYWAWEAEAVAIAPLPYSALVADFVIVRTLDVPSDFFVFDESYRAVVKNPLFCTLRGAAVARFLREQSLKIGVLSEYVFSTGRSKGVFRLGPAASLLLTDHVEINAMLALAVSSPDDLGLVLSTYAVAGIRYRWATGERQPKLPWQGEIIP
jgi:hypothetical protein